MRVQIQTPSSMEVSKVEVKDTGLTLTPVAVKGQHLLRVGYLVATGDNGSESTAVLVFNGNTGEFMVQKITQAAAPLAFDSMKPDDFTKKRQGSETGKKPTIGPEEPGSNA
jgi:hypothetical protein